MKKEAVFEKIRCFFAPVVTLVLGLILMVNPDYASALVARLLGFVFGLVAIGFGIGALANAQGRAGKVFGAIVCAVIGGWLGNNPLVLAAWFGRIIGIVLLIDGIQDILASRRQGTLFLLPLVAALVGLILIVMPMTASRIVFALCGLVLVVIGGVMLLERIRGNNRLNGPQDPNIIDAL